MSLYHMLWVALYLIVGYAVALATKSTAIESHIQAGGRKTDSTVKYLFGLVILLWPILVIAILADLLLRVLLLFKRLVSKSK